ncbi:hypothetical protein CU669_15120 [Paramagnetospirillum kuznetsovii]|uniref:Bbp19-like phage domain-containing protein n=1 Tax=Paramagnetospirillum kuznetsovii TaxID=2053833 RepID=A0A364NW06_9PROT|nr:hypothetical protein [Paramagnetospirillum kuznetsovii]RAU21085.1 hypothetical protein CU669_15120 [Paramagnetospirillum kuznetsovii]
MSDDAFNAADPEKVQARTKTEKQKAYARDRAFLALMNTQDGRAWVWNILSGCQVYGTSFHPSNAQTAFNEGKRNVGLILMADVHRLCPDLYPLMVKEANGG